MTSSSDERPGAPSGHADQARRLVAAARTGALGTLTADGHPFVSLVTVAAHGSTAVLHLSELAEHTRNLRRDGRASLLVTEAGGDAAPLARARATLVGTARPATGPEQDGARAAFLALHPDAARHEALPDFGYWLLDVEGVRWVGGFGRMSWIDAAAWRDTRD